MDEFLSLNESFVLAVVSVLLLMAIFSCAVVALDHWVRLGSSDPRPERSPRQRPPLIAFLHEYTKEKDANRYE